MGLFSGWFSKDDKEELETPATDWRREPRRRVATAWPAIEARIGGERAQVLDLSDKGFGMALDESRAPSQTLVEIWQGDELVTRGYALLAWRAGSRVGYSFATGLTVERIQEKRAAQAAARAAEMMPTRVAAREAIMSAARKSQEAETAKAKAGASARQSGAVSYLDEAELRAIQEAVTDASRPIAQASPEPKLSSADALRSRLKI